MVEDAYRYFRIEAKELLDDLYRAVAGLDVGATAAQNTAAILRSAHTLKGAARVVKQRAIADRAHALEEVLEPWRDVHDAVPRPTAERVTSLLDSIGAGVDALPGPESAPERPSPDDAAPHEPLRTVRADIAEMNELLDSVGEAHAQLSGLRRILPTLTQSTLSGDAGPPITGDPSPLSAGESDGGANQAGIEQRTVAHTNLIRRVEDGVGRLDKELRQIRDTAERLRLIPANTLFSDLARAARDVARAQDKKVTFDGRDGDVRLDAHVVHAAQTALQQIVRNAVAHGIETADERLARGKPAEGQVTLDITPRGRHVVFACHDDGRGIDVERLRAAAGAKGVALPADDVGNAPEQLLELLLNSGVSTADAVTEVSGRGIGFDVVRESAARLGGEIHVTTEAGVGTTVSLEVPLQVAAFEVLAVQDAGFVAHVPLRAVEYVFPAAPRDVHQTDKGEEVAYNGTAIPYLALSALVGTRVPTERRVHRCVVVVRGQQGIAAIGVHRLLGSSSIVVRPLPGTVDCSPVVSGVWLDVDGRPRPVLDPDVLITEARRVRTAPEVVDTRPRAPVLVVDDSLTTRMLEQSILESAGYRVDVASSAEEAFLKAQDSPYLLFLVDVEMPGMDGFTFVERTRAHPTMRNTPAILVTSRSSSEDRQRGLDAGASAYITKGDFDQSSLLDRIKVLTAA